ncbi:MAG: hypothetical protein RSF78_10645 [Bacteroidales bacterium]
MSSSNQYLPNHPSTPTYSEYHSIPSSKTLAPFSNEKERLLLSLFKTASHSVHGRVPARTGARPDRDAGAYGAGRAHFQAKQ